MVLAVWWKSLSGRKQESETRGMEIPDTRQPCQVAARPQPRSALLEVDTSPRIALNPCGQGQGQSAHSSGWGQLSEVSSPTLRSLLCLVRVTG